MRFTLIISEPIVSDWFILMDIYLLNYKDIFGNKYYIYNCVILGEYGKGDTENFKCFFLQKKKTKINRENVEIL